MAYAQDWADLYRHAGMQIDQILQGAKPADVPIYQSLGWKLIINLKTAKALGVEIPGSILTRADEVIE
jgi:putative ABC transport system substrate-binding protein